MDEAKEKLDLRRKTMTMTILWQWWTRWTDRSPKRILFWNFLWNKLCFYKNRILKKKNFFLKFFLIIRASDWLRPYGAAVLRQFYNESKIKIGKIKLFFFKTRLCLSGKTFQIVHRTLESKDIWALNRCFVSQNLISSVRNID